MDARSWYCPSLRRTSRNSHGRLIVCEKLCPTARISSAGWRIQQVANILPPGALFQNCAA